MAAAFLPAQTELLLVQAHSSQLPVDTLPSRYALKTAQQAVTLDRAIYRSTIGFHVWLLALNSISWERLTIRVVGYASSHNHGHLLEMLPGGRVY